MSVLPWPIRCWLIGLFRVTVVAAFCAVIIGAISALWFLAWEYTTVFRVLFAVVAVAFAAWLSGPKSEDEGWL
jgi:hypothetical protein